jgi:glutamate-1-semialdehyde 2,1-aminomutase
MDFTQSERLYEQSKQTLAGGVASSLRAAMKPVPLFLQSGKGARIRDVDGNEYIDYIMGYGPLILGHSHPQLIEAVCSKMREGQQFGMQHEGEIALSRRIVELVPCADKVLFSGSGTEAVMMALRLARAYTGRSKIIRFEGHYHGWSDAIFTSFPSPDMAQGDRHSLAGTVGQSEHALEDILLLPWNDPEALQRTLETQGEQIAAVITEPVMCNSGCIRPLPGYLESMREWTRKAGTVLIFDEVITGFRVGIGGAQERLGITPDLTIMGKAVAGGFPLSVVAGHREIMDLVSNAKVSHLGTLNGNVVSMAAGLAALDILSKNNGSIYEEMEQIADRLIAGLQEIFAVSRIPVLINRFGPVFHLMFTGLREVSNFTAFNQRDSARYARFAEMALTQGLAVRPNGLWYVSATHTSAEVEETLEIVRRIASKM